ncbi:DNA translocase FtsK [Cohnella candidum]|uniref:DNA translocase FtsK n=1 Tax=Cohnella candidum TaxID=2674991 RepID=A0A3G3JW14_9BACL|nr:DNA translocase FtsK [Cohnella candidum]AYQ72041.1 DNA translocase FtsK [Cohnella candidum]
MAKRKKKRASFGTNLKYEIYGILLITLSVITFYGEGRGAWALTSLSSLVLGKFYFLMALLGIWIGLYVMMKRQWPRGWTPRRSGFLLFCLACTLMSTISFAQSRLAPVEAVSAPNIIKQMGSALSSQVLNPPDPAAPEDTTEIQTDGTGEGTGEATDPSVVSAAELKPWEKDIGGGMLGALQYSVFYWMFGYYGAKFIMYIQFAISILLITNRSYVEMGRSIRLFLLRVMPLLAARLSSGRKLQSAKAVPVAPAGKREAQIAPEPLPDDDGLDELPFTPQQRKTPLFFQLFHGKPERETEDRPGDAWEDEEEPEWNGASASAPGARPDKRQETQKIDTERADAPHAPEQLSGPRFTDFTVQAQTTAAPWQEDEAEEHAEWGDDEAGLPDDPDSRVEAGEVPPEAEKADSAAETPAAKPAAPKKKPKPYRLPGVSLLDKPAAGSKSGNANDYIDTARKLEATLESFGVRAKVLDVARGPAVTRYELQPDVGVKVSRIVSLTDDIALALAAKDIRMEAPIPGKSAIGIEVPNNEVSVVTLREVVETQAFQEAPSKLTVAFGRDISGQPIVGNLAKMPHLLVAGATGSGKSVCINGIITSVLYKAKPDEVKFLMIDPKMVELNVYNGIPHLLAPVVTDPRRASLALKKIVVEMEKRYEKFSKSATRNIEGYNALMLSGDNPDGVLPYIVVIVDELADLMMVAAGDVEDAITRLAQMARAAGIHLIIATQRPSVDVITGVIKANIPSRIAFGVSSQVDSRTILDMVGAEKLLGRGDMLFLPMGASKPIRVQGAFLSDSEVEAVVGHARGQAEAEYNEELVPEIDETEAEAENEIMDELFDQAVQIVLEAKQASVSLLQRRMRIGYTRAARLIDSMEAKGIVGPYEGSKPREVLMSMEQYQQRIPS